MTTRYVTRRSFLLGGVALAAGTFLVRGALGSRVRAAAGVIAIVRGRLPYLRVEPTGLDQFALDIVERWPSSVRRQLAVHSVVQPLLSRFVEPMPLEIQVVSRYLMSSDFFRRGADETREIGYVGFYDPYTMICGNPFAQLD